MKRTALILTLAALAGAPAAAQAPQKAVPAAQTPILPGYWEYTARVAMIPVKTERKCVAASEIDRFIAFPGNRHYKCSYPSKSISGGQLSLEGTCVDKRGREAPISAQGTYAPESFRMNFNLRTINGLPLAGTMNAKRISATCPAETAS